MKKMIWPVRHWRKLTKWHVHVCCQSFFLLLKNLLTCLLRLTEFALLHSFLSCNPPLITTLQAHFPHTNRFTFSWQKYSIKFWNILPFLELCPSFIDKAPRPSISDVIWILSSDTICQTNYFQIVRWQCCLTSSEVDSNLLLATLN